MYLIILFTPFSFIVHNGITVCACHLIYPWLFFVPLFLHVPLSQFPFFLFYRLVSPHTLSVYLIHLVSFHSPIVSILHCLLPFQVSFSSASSIILIFLPCKLLSLHFPLKPFSSPLHFLFTSSITSPPPSFPPSLLSYCHYSGVNQEGGECAPIQCGCTNLLMCHLNKFTLSHLHFFLQDSFLYPSTIIHLYILDPFLILSLLPHLRIIYSLALCVCLLCYFSFLETCLSRPYPNHPIYLSFLYFLSSLKC